LVFMVLLIGSAMAMGSHSGSHHSTSSQSIAIVYRQYGPVLKAYSQYSVIYVIKIDDNDVYNQDSDPDGYLDFDLFDLNLPNGKHSISITPINLYGEAPSVKFNLQITGKNPQLWEILPDKKLWENDPVYKESFSEDLKIYLMPQK